MFITTDLYNLYIYIICSIFPDDLPSGLFSIADVFTKSPVNKPRKSKGEHEKMVEYTKQKLLDVHLAIHMAALLQKASLCLLRCSQGAIRFGHDNQVTIFFNSLKRFPHPELVPCTAKILGSMIQESQESRLSKIPGISTDHQYSKKQYVHGMDGSMNGMDGWNGWIHDDP